MLLREQRTNYSRDSQIRLYLAKSSAKQKQQIQKEKGESN